jgi:glycolate oxidase iron-sulfur subunit
MQVQLDPALRDRDDAQAAARILRSCVHCGFCSATCPTYQLFGDELDGPRGRISLIKQVLEGEAPTARTRLHLDRCLTCRACETTCPSGVEYGALLDTGRALVDERLPRSPLSRLGRGLLAAWLTGALFAPSVALGRLLRPLLPERLRASLLRRQQPGSWPQRRQPRCVLLLAGCVQPSLAPNINAATARVLDALGIEVVVPPTAGCCGALRHHLDEQARALDDIRRNIDAWWPAVEAGAEAIVINASGCGTMLRDYGRLLKHDLAYAEKAAQVSALARDVVELVVPHVGRIAERAAAASGGGPPRRVVFHPPCSLQHGLKIRGVVERVLLAAGAQLQPFTDAQLCCGSAGTYALLQPGTSRALRERKLAALQAPSPQMILSANIGCISQLSGDDAPPVRHWIEWLDERLR